MRTYQLFILVAAATLSLCAVTDPDGEIYMSVQAFLPKIPEMREEIYKSEAASTPKLQTAIGLNKRGGFTKFSEQTETYTYSNVLYKDYGKMCTFLLNLVELPTDYQKSLITHLEILKFSKTINILSTDFIFSKQNGKTKYVTIMAQRNKKKGTYDFLIGDMKAEFDLASDIMILQSHDRGFLGIWKQTKTEVIVIPKDITPAQRDTIMKYMEVTVFEKFGEALGL